MEKLLGLISPRRVRPGGGARRAVVFVNWWLNRRILMLQPTCLKRSILIYRFLTLEGLDITIHYGVRNVESGLDGHSWLTLEGRPFLEDGLTADMYRETFVFGQERKA